MEEDFHPHPGPLPSRAREIKVKGFHRPSLPRGPLSRPPKVKMKGRDGVGEMVTVKGSRSEDRGTSENLAARNLHFLD